MDLLAPSIIIAILLVPYIAVLGIILYSAKSDRMLVKKDYSYKPTVTIFLPTYNEESNISKKLDNLMSQTYPITEILIFDCSTDGTVDIISRYQQKFPIINLVRQPVRIGMARTLNEAFKVAKGEIFVKTDCDSISDLDALRQLVANFADDSVGGATGIVIAEKGVEKYFRGVMTRIQVAESNIDSTLIAHSTSLLAFRSKAIVPINENSVADDTEEFLLLRRKGYRTVIDTTVKSKEEVPDDLLVRRAQKNRRSQGIVKVLLENTDMLMNKKYSRYGTWVLPIEWFILILSPILLIGLTITIAYGLFLVNPLFAIGFVLLLVVAYLHNSNPIYAIIDTELSGLVGFAKSVLKGNGDGLWQKVR